MRRGLGYPRRSIRVKLFLSYILITLPLLALALYFAREWSLQQRSLLTSEARQGAMDTALRLGSFFDRTGVTLSAIARNPAMRSNDPDEVARVLNSFLPVVPRLSSILVARLDGSAVAGVPNTSDAGGWIGDRDYFQAVAGGVSVAVSGGLRPRGSKPDAAPGFAIAVPILGEDGHPLRVLVGRMPVEDAKKDLLPTLDTSDSTVLVLDQHDRIVLCPRQEMFGANIALTDVPSAGEGADGVPRKRVFQPLTGESAMARVWPVGGGSGWSVVAIERTDSLRADDIQRATRVALLVLAALALSAATAYLLGGRLSGRVTRLSRAAALVAGGKLGEQVPVDGFDETTVLSQNFNAMSTRLVEMVKQLDDTHRGLRQSYVEVGQALTAGYEVEKTLQLILRVVMSRLDTSAALVGRLDRRGRYLRWVALAGPLEPQLLGSRVPVDEASLAGRAVVRNTVTQGEEPTIWPIVDGAREGLPRENPSGLVAPLRVGGQVTGAIEILGETGRSFDAEEVSSLLAFAESAALALDKAALYENTERQKLLMQSILDSVPIAVAVVRSPACTHELANPAFRSMIGAATDEGLDGSTSPLAAALRAAVQTAHETGATQRLGTLADTSGDQDRASHWTVTCSPLPGAVGHPDWILVTGVETSEYVAAHRAIEDLAGIAEQRAHELETVIASMTDGVLVVDKDGGLVMVNQTARQIIGAELLQHAQDAHRTRNLRYPSGQPVPQDQMPRQRAARGERYSDCEMIVQRPEGQERWLSVSGAPLLDRDGRPRGGICMFRDATEQRRRAARQQLLAEVSQLFNSSIDLDEVLRLVTHKVAISLDNWCAIHLLDESGQYLYLRSIHHPDPELTTRAERILGGRFIQPDELSGGRVILEGQPVFIEKFAPQDRRHFTRWLRGLARSKQEYATAFLAVPLRSRGRVLGAMSVTCTGPGRQLTREDLDLAIDLAERAALALDNATLFRQTEDERLRLQSIVDSLPEGIMIAEGDQSRVTAANRVAESMWGRPIPAGTKLGDLSLALIAGKRGVCDATPSFDLLDTIATGRAMLSYEAAILRPDGSTLDVLASSAPYSYRSGGGVGTVTVFQDISRIKEVERLKDEFLSVTSHELRTPLTSLKGFAQLLLRRAQRTPGREADVEALEVINRQINRMVALVGDLLDVSRIEAGQVILSRQKLDLVPLVRRVVKQAQVTAKQHRLKVEVVDGGVSGSWDERRIEQVITNLLDNAVKYSPGGSIEVTVRRWDDEAVVSVRDHGVGLSEEHQAHLFQRFYRGGNILTRSVGGLGLGLYICDQLVRCHGGRMWVDSAEGVGSTFWFALPIVDEDDRGTGGEDDDE